MDNELRDMIIRNTGEDHARFYVPGHKGRTDLSGEQAPLDVTELYFTDDLNDPEGPIARAERSASELFGSRFTLFTVNGSSAAVMASVMSCAKEGSYVLLPSDSHLSCYYGAMHASSPVKRLYIKDPVMGISEQELTAFLEKTDETFSCCVITSPTYYGCCAELGKIVSILHERGIKVIADESHGTHLAFTRSAGLSAIACGADYVVHSAHKTIGALTQTAMLHVNDPQADENLVRLMMRTVQSTSPSFPLICSLMDSVERLKTNAGLFDDQEIWYNEILDSISHAKHLEMPDFGDRADRLKVTVRYSGDMDAFVRILRERKVDEEMIIGDLAVFSMGIGTTAEDTAALIGALREADERYDAGASHTGGFETLPVSPQKTGMNEALRRPSDYVLLEECAERISSGFVSVYPPGAPVLIPGSLITDEVIGYIKRAHSAHGIYNGCLRVIQREKDSER